MQKPVTVSFVSYLVRIALTIISISIFSFINFSANTQSTLINGKIAAEQFKNSDAAYVGSQIGSYLFGQMGISILVLFALLALFWYKPFRVFMQSLAVITLFIIVGNVHTANAYYDKQDFTEPYFILPNESAFYIPDVGDNKDSQASFGSEAYLNEKKIPAKRFIIPHTKLAGSGIFSDFYVPAGRLIIVDRTPYNREWVKAAHRGTSTADQSFPCQSKEGINVTVEVAIATSVTENNAPKFLYNFGVNPPKGNRTDPQVIFTSVFNGRSLAEVMDTVGRGAVQTAVCSEVSTRTLDVVNADADKILAAVTVKANTWANTRGIIIDYIGWAGTFSFDPEVQSAINRLFIANKDAASAQILAPYVQTLTALANADAVRNFGNKTDGKLPTNLTLWNMPDFLNNFLGNKASTSAK